MRTNLLPEMQSVKLTNREGQELVLFVELRKLENTTYVFLSDTNQLGSSELAKDAVFYLEKISKKLNLNAETTVFYRHIFQEQMGSLFGRFNVDWKNLELRSYQFKMLTNIEDLEAVKKSIAVSESIRLEDYVSEEKNAA